MADELRRTQLYQWHVDHGGRMVPFAGWEMPVQYPDGPLHEHHTTRKSAGLFDIDHMGQFEVRGAQAGAFMNRMVTYDVDRMNLFDAHYAIFCYEDGGTVDDLFVYKLPDSDSPGKEYYFLVVNAANRDKDFAWLQPHARDFEISLTDVSDETYMLAFQGPLAVSILDRLTDADLASTPRFTAARGRLLGKIPALFGRTGYTGEDGYELFFPAESALDVWQAILEEGKDSGAAPIGLAARDSLRFEPCMPLYGHEISADITPLEARLSFALSLENDFIGREALLKQKLEKSGRALVGFELVERGVAREGYPVIYKGEAVGKVTSGMFSPTTGRYLGLALVPRSAAVIGTEIIILIRDKEVKARVVNRPFYQPVYRR